MKKDSFFNFLVLILGILFFGFQFSVEYQFSQALQEVFEKVQQQGDIQPSLQSSYMIKRILLGIVLTIVSYFTIRKSTAFKIVGKIGIFFLFLGILVPLFFLAFVLFDL